MEQRTEEKVIDLQEKRKVSLIEKIGKKIPDPVIIFAICSMDIFKCITY